MCLLLNRYPKRLETHNNLHQKEWNILILYFHKIKFFILISIYTASLHEGVPTRLHVRRTLHNSVSHSRFCPTTLTCLCIIPIRCSGVLIMIFFPIGRISLIFYHRCKCTAAVVKRHMLRFSIHTTQHKQQHRPKKQSNQFPNFLPPRLLIPYFGVS